MMFSSLDFPSDVSSSKRSPNVPSFYVVGRVLMKMTGSLALH